jgi:hypothetical protein
MWCVGLGHRGPAHEWSPIFTAICDWGDAKWDEISIMFPLVNTKAKRAHLRDNGTTKNASWSCDHEARRIRCKTSQAWGH